MKNYRGFKGWIYVSMDNFERILFSVHRITGVLLILYLLVHILIVGSRAFGKESWETTMEAVGTGNPIVHFFEYLLVGVVLFHALNGIRLLITELGFFLGKAERPDYPYVTNSIKRPRPLLVFLMIVGFFILAYGAYEFFFIAH